MDWTKQIDLSRKPTIVGKDGTWWLDITGPAHSGDPVKAVLTVKAAARGLHLVGVNWWTRKAQVTVF
jgi:hypothetical protein